MPELSLENPVRIQQATKDVSDPALMTLAAFLLAAGVWYRRYDPKQSILPPEELQPLGMSGWQLSDTPPSEGLNPYQSPFAVTQIESDRLSRSGPAAFHVRLGELISQAFSSRSFFDLAQAVIFAIYSPDALVRISAPTSAFEIFNYLFQHRVQMLTSFDLAREDTSAVMAKMLLAKTFGWGVSASGASVAPPPSALAPTKPGLILIHGTNFPPNRPVWSVPGVGALFKHIAGFRGGHLRWSGLF